MKNENYVEISREARILTRYSEQLVEGWPKTFGQNITVQRQCNQRGNVCDLLIL